MAKHIVKKSDPAYYSERDEWGRFLGPLGNPNPKQADVREYGNKVRDQQNEVRQTTALRQQAEEKMRAVQNGVGEAVYDAAWAEFRQAKSVDDRAQNKHIRMVQTQVALENRVKFLSEEMPSITGRFVPGDTKHTNEDLAQAQRQLSNAAQLVRRADRTGGPKEIDQARNAVREARWKAEQIRGLQDSSGLEAGELPLSDVSMIMPGEDGKSVYITTTLRVDPNEVYDLLIEQGFDVKSIAGDVLRVRGDGDAVAVIRQISRLGVPPDDYYVDDGLGTLDFDSPDGSASIRAIDTGLVSSGAADRARAVVAVRKYGDGLAAAVDEFAETYDVNRVVSRLLKSGGLDDPGTVEPAALFGLGPFACVKCHDERAAAFSLSGRQESRVGKAAVSVVEKAIKDAAQQVQKGLDDLGQVKLDGAFLVQPNAVQIEADDDGLLFVVKGDGFTRPAADALARLLKDHHELPAAVGGGEDRAGLVRGAYDLVLTPAVQAAVHSVAKDHDAFMRVPFGAKPGKVVVHAIGKDLFYGFTTTVGVDQIGWAVPAGKVEDGWESSVLPTGLFKSHRSAAVQVIPEAVDKSVDLADVAVEFGVQREGFHEYFLEGDAGGRLVFTWKGDEGWQCFRGKLLPAVLSDRAVAKGLMPPDGISWLPEALEKCVPEHLRYWQAGGEAARGMRDGLVKAGWFQNENLLMVGGQYERVEAVAKGLGFGRGNVDTENGCPYSGSVAPILDKPNPVADSNQLNVHLSKADGIADDRHHVLGVVMIPNNGGDGDEVDPDRQGDVVSAEEIQRAAWNWLRDYRHFKVYHEGRAVGEAQVLESYLAPTDLEIAGRTIKAGTWLVRAEVDGTLWELIDDGHLNAFSIGGTSYRVPVE